MNKHLELELSPSNFRRITELIRGHAGIELGASKQQLVHSRLLRRLRSRALNSFDEYVALLEAGDRNELQEFTNALTTNLTSFFREPHHFEVLARSLQERRTARSAASGPIRIWSAACSTGEEPYSIAITAAEAFNSRTPPVRIVASDIDTAVLETARRGAYAAATLAAMSPTRRKQFFAPESGGQVQIQRELQELMTFRQVNLLAPSIPVEGPIDFIFCRNVLIYFDKPTQRRVLERFARLLRADGLLFTGHAETLFNATDLFEARGNTVYALAARSVRGLSDVASSPAGANSAHKQPVASSPAETRAEPHRTAQVDSLIVIGSSTGGPEALRRVLAAMPRHCPPICIAQHIPAAHVRSLIERLNASSQIEVAEARHAAVLRRGHAYIAPGDIHLKVKSAGTQLVSELDHGPPVGRHRPAVDVLFHSAAQIAGKRLFGIILTGMGTDGAAGLLAMKRSGAHTYAQDEASCVVFGMPRQAIALNAVDEVLPLGEIAARVIRKFESI